MVLPTVTSGMNIAQRRCAHSPVLVCLKAPPSLGQKTQGWMIDEESALTIEAAGGTYHRDLRRDCALAAEPLPLGNVRHAVTVFRTLLSGFQAFGESWSCLTLMYRQIASIAEDNSITVLAFSVIAYRTGRVLRGQANVRFRHPFHLRRVWPALQVPLSR
jgi:hypothetical protein